MVAKMSSKIDAKIVIVNWHAKIGVENWHRKLPSSQSASPAGGRTGVRGEVNLPPVGRRFGRKEEKKKRRKEEGK